MMGIKITVRNKMPTFIKNGKPISIKDFSSGESEIIFRSFDLLKNENIDGNIVLIDEPEVHLHPSLQQKIYKFYKRILSNNEQQTNQLFIATHSEYLLKSAINDPNTLVLTLK
jgi:predicted ATP-dependent endonuclease of OLD family